MSPGPSASALSFRFVNEAARIQACLECLIAQSRGCCRNSGGGRRLHRWHSSPSLNATDRATRRVRLIDASPVPSDWTGKAWGLYVGLKNAAANAEWVLSIDADVRCSPLLVPSLLAHAERTGVSTFSVATRQHLSGLADALLHPSLLTTLVYRLGIPGKATRNLHRGSSERAVFH